MATIKQHTLIKSSLQLRDELSCTLQGAPDIQSIRKHRSSQYKGDKTKYRLKAVDVQIFVALRCTAYFRNGIMKLLQRTYQERRRI
jgi:hypothetical protein